MCNRSPEAEVTDGLSCLMWKPNSGPLVEQQVLLTNQVISPAFGYSLILWVGMSKVEMEDGRWKGGYYITKDFKLTFPKYIEFFRYKIFEEKKYLERRRNSRRK